MQPSMSNRAIPTTPPPPPPPPRGGGGGGVDSEFPLLVDYILFVLLLHISFANITFSPFSPNREGSR